MRSIRAEVSSSHQSQIGFGHDQQPSLAQLLDHGIKEWQCFKKKQKQVFSFITKEILISPFLLGLTFLFCWDFLREEALT